MNEKNLEINRSNQALLNKLVEISTGKWSCIPSRDRSVDVQRTFGPVGNGKSLNFNSRKRESDRIERENHAFAKRLFDRGASMSKKKLEDDYQRHIQYRNQI